MNNLRFTSNWNGKLYADKYFTTIRMWNEKKYVIGEFYEVYLNDEYIGTAELRSTRRTSRGKLNEFVSGLDTGYPVAATQQIIGRMYKNNADNPIGLYLFRWVKKQPGTSVDVSGLIDKLKALQDA
jgi:hypothetical protein